MKALKEIKKFQSLTKLLIQKLPFQRLVWEILKAQRVDLKNQGKGQKSTPRGRGGVPGQALGKGRHVFNPCKESQC